MEFTDSALSLLKRLEGCRLTAYPDQGGVWTIGFGHTGNVHAGLVWTQEQCEAQLLADLAPRIEGVRKMVGTAPLTDNQFSALVIFAFNVGLIAFSGSTALRDIRTGRLQDVPAELARWNKVKDASGVPMANAGLAHRRAAEIDLWNSAAPLAVA